MRIFVFFCFSSCFIPFRKFLVAVARNKSPQSKVFSYAYLVIRKLSFRRSLFAFRFFEEIGPR